MPGIDEVPALACPLSVSELCGLRVPWQLLESEGAEQVDVTCTVAILVLMPATYSAVSMGALHGVHEMGMSVSPYDANHASCASRCEAVVLVLIRWPVARQHQIRNLQRRLFICNESSIQCNFGNISVSLFHHCLFEHRILPFFVSTALKTCLAAQKVSPRPAIASVKPVDLVRLSTFPSPPTPLCAAVIVPAVVTR